jgi:hypothetical protein
MVFEPNCVVIAPNCGPEAEWDKFDLPGFVEKMEREFPSTERICEGYSKGANGAVLHGHDNPELFDRVVAIAGGYRSYLPCNGLTLVAGSQDQKWGHASEAYAQATGESVLWVDAPHDPVTFYRVLDWEALY